MQLLNRPMLTAAIIALGVSKLAGRFNQSLGRCAHHRAMLKNLTRKQHEAVELLSQHMTTKEIARSLGIAPTSVDQRLGIAMRKQGVSSRRELARTFVRLQCEALAPIADIARTRRKRGQEKRTLAVAQMIVRALRIAIQPATTKATKTNLPTLNLAGSIFRNGSRQSNGGDAQ